VRGVSDEEIRRLVAAVGYSEALTVAAAAWFKTQT